MSFAATSDAAAWLFKAKLALGSMQGIGFCGIVCAAQACSARLQKPLGTGERPVPAPGSWAFSFAKAKLSAALRYAERGRCKGTRFSKSSSNADRVLLQSALKTVAPLQS